jgi:LysM repeat protein
VAFGTAAEERRLDASVSRRAQAAAYEDEEEPTTSFKTALVVVVLLHLIAGFGVFKFSTAKKNADAQTGMATASVASPSAANASIPPRPVRPAAVAATPAPATAAASPIPGAKPRVESPGAARDSGKTHVVTKDETLFQIARQLHVDQKELMSLNQIDDPKKLRVGQKLRIPTAKK